MEENKMESLQEETFGSLDELLAGTDLSKVTAEGVGFEDLKEGYYLCELKKAELTKSKSSGRDMVALSFQVVENGYEVGDNGLVELKNTKNRYINVYYVFKNQMTVQRFATDMLKFEGSEPGKPILEKECFMTEDLLIDALEIIKGLRIYISITSSTKENQIFYWKNLLSWKRVQKLGLPM